MLIQDYQEHWEKDFKIIMEILKENIPLNVIQIEHVGSTSVKHLAAKPIIDIDLVYKNQESFKSIKLGLEKLGYYHNGNQGILGREVFKRVDNSTKHIILDSINHHLYVCHVDNREHKSHLYFRNYLRGNERKRKEYEMLKYRIAKRANQDKYEYSKLKQTMAKEFIESIIRKSREQ